MEHCWAAQQWDIIFGSMDKAQKYYPREFRDSCHDLSEPARTTDGLGLSGFEGTHSRASPKADLLILIQQPTYGIQ